MLDVDAAVLRMPDERGDQLVPRAMHVRDERLAEPLRAILVRAAAALAGAADVFRSGGRSLLDPRSAASLGPAHELLVPFLEKGSTAAVIPLATPAEMLADADARLARPGPRRSTATTLEAALVDRRPGRARDRQRAPLPAAEAVRRHDAALAAAARAAATSPGSTSARSTSPSARVDVGGDVYDFLELADGRLAVVLGDVTGHGIDATADMAMAKFVFRSLAREHSEPGDFLAAANDVVVERDRRREVHHDGST